MVITPTLFVFIRSDPYSNAALFTMEKLRSNADFLVGGLSSSIIDLRNYYTTALTQLEIIILIVIAVCAGCFSQKSVLSSHFSQRRLHKHYMDNRDTLLNCKIHPEWAAHIFDPNCFSTLSWCLLGNDFTVFILTRVREEQSKLGAREGLRKGYGWLRRSCNFALG